MSASDSVVLEQPAIQNPASTVSVLVPAWNEADRISSCIESLLAIDDPSIEILVSAGGSDGTWEKASEYAGDRVIVIRQEPGEGKQRALRNLIRHAHGEIIYLTDGDSLVSRETFQRIVGPIITGDSDVVTGSYRPYETELDNPFVLYQWSIDRVVDRTRASHSEGISGANTALSRRALIASGGFQDDVPTGTDYHLARQIRQAGFHIRYIDSPVQTRYATTVNEFMRRRARWLRNTMMHGVRFNDRAEIKSTALTLTLGTGFCVTPLSWRWTRKTGIAAWLLGFSYLILRRHRYTVELSRERALPLRFGYYCRLPWYTLLDQIVALRALTDLVLPNRRWRW